MDEPALDVECPICDADVGEPCVDQPIPHLERQDAAHDPGVFGAYDLDGDGVQAYRDLDDPGYWF